MSEPWEIKAARLDLAAKTVVLEVRHLGVDEKSFRKRPRYGTLVNDLDRGRVLEVVETRTTEAACEGLDALGPEVLSGVEAGPIDVSSAYEGAFRQRCPRVVTIYVRFRVSVLLGKALDTVGRAETGA